jgi:hypothetical protein
MWRLAAAMDREKAMAATASNSEVFDVLHLCLALHIIINLFTCTKCATVSRYVEVVTQKKASLLPRSKARVFALFADCNT